MFLKNNTPCQSMPFSELLINENICHPKIFILKTRNSSDSKYLTCLLDNDDETWDVLDERENSWGTPKNESIQYETEVCGIFYEN